MQSRDPSTNVVLLEDAAAVLGVVMAAGCMGLTSLTGECTHNQLITMHFFFFLLRCHMQYVSTRSFRFVVMYNLYSYLIHCTESTSLYSGI